MTIATATGSSAGNSTATASPYTEVVASAAGVSSVSASGEGLLFGVGGGHSVGSSHVWGTGKTTDSPTLRTLSSSSKASRIYWGGEDVGPTRVDDWPNPPRLIKTVMIYTDSFQGTVALQGSLYDAPGADDWFDVAIETFDCPTRYEGRARNRVLNLQNRVIWMRATVDASCGRVDRIIVM